MAKNKYNKYWNKPGQGPDPDANSTRRYCDEDTDPCLPALIEPEYGNFKKIMKHYRYVLLEHNVTKERKWVDLGAIYIEGVPNAFYDADVHFCPKGVSKWE